MVDSAASAQDLTLIPRPVRDKLDRVGIKLHLREWQLFGLPQRQHLDALPCDSAQQIAHYRRTVEAMVLETCGHSAEPLSKTR